MKTFRGWVITEVTAQKESKDFETYIANLAVKSKGSISKSDLTKLYSGSKSKQRDTIDAVIMLNKRKDLG